MQCQLTQLILWPRANGFAPRVLAFERGALNVITGSSKTGKSAIIPIIDYCLGSGRCTIPVSTIRDACAWFGIVLTTDQGELLLARREPGELRVSSEMFMLEAPSVEVPTSIAEANATVDSVKARLDALAGLTQLGVDQDGSFGRPSFRDMVALTFQPQSVIANPNVLFYKADTVRHREKLRAIFPYVLGAVTPKQLAWQHELDRLAVEIRRRERDVERLQTLSAQWVADIASDIARARELGLLREAPDLDAEPEALVELLRQVVASAEHDVRVIARDVSDVAGQLAALRAQEIEASDALSAVRRRVTAMRDYQQTAATFGQTLTVRRDRLAVAEWIAEQADRHLECPLCGGPARPPEAALVQLRSALDRVTTQTARLARMPVAFDREYTAVQGELDRAAEELNAIKSQRRLLEDAASPASRPQFDVAATARFLGHLEDAVERYGVLTGDDVAVAALEELRRRRDLIAAKLQKAGTRRRLERVLSEFSRLAGLVVATLDAEFPDALVELDVQEITLRVVREDGEAFLSELGSGANWLAYHIAASVAMHEVLLKLPVSPVPTFVVYDQPSQVYFPRSAERMRRVESEKTEDTATGSDEPRLGARVEGQRQKDVEAVREVFAALSAAVARMQGRWQAIVIDHAQDDIWGSVPGVHVVCDWWDGEKLVPEPWIAAGKVDISASPAPKCPPSDRGDSTT